MIEPAAGYVIGYNGNDGLYFNGPVPTNLALTGRGGIAFASSEFGPSHGYPYHRVFNLNDGLYGNSNSWIANDGDAQRYAGVMLNGLYAITSIAWGRNNKYEFNDRWGGIYVLQFTSNGSSWTTVGQIQFLSNDDMQAGGLFTGPFRHEFTISTSTGQPIVATGFRLIVPYAGGDLGTAIDEIEVYGTIALPEVQVTGNGVVVVDGDAIPSLADHTDFGTTAVSSGLVTRTFTIQNTGLASLTLGSVTIGGANAADFTVTSQPSSTLPAGGSTSFMVKFDPSAAGLRGATLSFSNNDSDENPFNFSLQGTGTVPPAIDSPASASITASGAALGGNVTSDGGAAVTERGVVYAKTAINSDPLIGGTGVTKAAVTGTTGVFTVPVTGLAFGTAYSFKAYATNGTGTGYTTVATFTTGNTAPVVTLNGSNPRVIEASLDAYADPGATAFDAEEGPLTPTLTANSVVPNMPGSYAVTWTATDSLGLTGSATRTVYVTDTTAPSITDVPADIVVITPNPAGTTVTYAPATATDAVGVTSLTYSHPSGSTFPIGLTPVTITARDAANNANSIQFTVTVRGTPTVTLTGNTPLLFEAAATYTDPGATATDPEDGTLTPMITANTVVSNTPGTYAVTWTATDSSGLPGTATRTVNVVDTTAPDTAIVSGPSDPTTSTTATFTFSGTDAGTGVAIFKSSLDGSSFATATSPQSFSGLATGSHTFAVRAVDGAGNTDPSPATFTWTITAAPTVTAPTVAGVRLTGAVAGGNVTSDGGEAVTERGMVYSISATNSDPVIGGTGVTKVAGTGTTGIFTVSLTGLTAGTAYSFKAYAINSAGTGYSAASTFTTRSGGLETYQWANFAGLPGGPGNADGPGVAARFNLPHYAAADSSGNLYVPDTYNHTIRKITSSGVVTTLAGLAGNPGSADGTGNAARFTYPTGAALDSSGNLYVADGNNTIRKIVLSTCAVTTLAGTAGSSGSADGTGPAARFDGPTGLAVDGSGNLYVADYSNHAIRKIVLSTAQVTTFAGSVGNPGSGDGTGTAASFHSPEGLAADSSGNLYVTDRYFCTIRKIVASTAQVTTLAGTAGSAGSTDATGPAARFTNPSGVAADTSGNVYVADFANHTIRKIAVSTAAVTTLAGTAGSSGNADGTGSAARFNQPYGVAADGSGNVYVTDFSNSTIRKIVASSGVVTTYAGTPPNSGSTDGSGTVARFNGPRGATVDGSGNVYVADFTNHTIRKITAAGAVSTLAGVAGASGSADGTGSAARFYNPQGVVVDGSGNVFVADQNNHTIRKITPAGEVSTVAGTAGSNGSTDATGTAAWFNGPREIAIDGSGNLYVADTFNHTIRKITPAGVVSTLAGLAGNSGSADGTGSAARFNGPEGVAVDSSGNVYVADNSNHTIRKITPAGVVTTLAGFAGSTGTTDATGSAARFKNPLGIAVDGSGDLYVADLSNHTIRKITPAGEVTTVGGTAGVVGGADGWGALAQFSSPTGIAVASNGDLFVTDTNNHRIIQGVLTWAATVPVLATPTSSSVMTLAATLGGNVTSDGGDAITERGLVYAATAANSDPTIGGTGVMKVTATGTTGVFTVPVSGLAAGTAYTFKAYATNGSGTGYTLAGTFTTNTPPTDIIFSGTIREGVPNGTALGTLSAVDPDVGQTHTFTFVSGPGDTDNGSLPLFGSGLVANNIDFETKSSYSIRIQADDGAGGVFAKALTIPVVNVNERPTFTVGANQTIAHTTASQTVPGWATGIDDGDRTVTQALTFNVNNNNPSLFTTPPSVASDGTLTYTPSGLPGTATVLVTLTDDASINGDAALNTAVQSFTITVQPSPVQSWALSQGLTGTDVQPTATPFHDGVPNLLKYAFNLNGAGPDSHRMPTGGNSGLPDARPQGNGVGRTFRFEFVRRIGSGLIYTPQISGTLVAGSWVDVEAPMAFTETVPPTTDPQWERAVVEVPIPDEDSEFGRVLVTAP